MTLQGWICSRCGASNSPLSAQCTCKPASKGSGEQRIQELARDVSAHRQECERERARIDVKGCWEVKACEAK